MKTTLLSLSFRTGLAQRPSLSSSSSVNVPSRIRLSAILLGLFWVLLLASPLQAQNQNQNQNQSQNQTQPRPRTAQFTQQKALYLEQIEELESQFGPLDRRLLEPLEALANLETEYGDIEGAGATLRRQLQITRNAFGFEDPRLLPIYNELIRAAVAQGLWEEVGDTLTRRSQLLIDQLDSGPQSGEAAQRAYLTAVTLGLQADWLVQQLAFLPTRDAVSTFFEAREIEDRINDLARDSLESLESDEGPLDLDTFAQWARVAYRQALSDISLVQMLNAGGGFAYDSVDYLTRRQGLAAMQKLSSPGLGGRLSSGPLNRVPMLENGDPVGIGYLRDSYFTVRRLDTQLEQWLESESAADSQSRERALEMLGMLRIAKGDFQIIQQRGSGIREYKQAQELLRQAGIDQQAIDAYFARPVRIPVQELVLSFDENSAETCLASTTALSERLPSVPQPKINDANLQLALPSVDLPLQFDVSRRGRATNVKLLAEFEDKAMERLARTVRRALQDQQFRPVVFEGRTRRAREQCMTIRVPVLD